MSRRRRRLTHRAVPVAVAALVAFVAGLVIGLQRTDAAQQVARAYAHAWVRTDVAAMYALLSPGSQRRMGPTAFATAVRNAAATATTLSLRVIGVGSESHGTVPVQMAVRTRLFGTLRETLLVPIVSSSAGPRIRYRPYLLFPGLQPGERLIRTDTLAPRANLLADDGTPLAEGPGRTSPIADVASEIAGRLGPIPAAQAGSYAALGYPANAQIGLNGLERVFQTQLAGTPGGTLLAGGRVLARAAPIAGHTVRTTIDPTLERAAIAATGGQFAGIAAMNPHTGAIEALAGVAFSAVQPPGSTMKIVTATAALQAGLVNLSSTFPVQTSTTLDGFTMQNANGEACGGSLVNAFAVSCNSVFAPLGARVGAANLVATAERFGFNQPVGIAGASESTIPLANQLASALDVGSSAIGQGKVQASALEMTDVAATIAMGGRRPIPTLVYGATPRFVRVTSRRVAREVQQMMIAVVSYGTGTSAQIPGVVVAGKTGTAELRTTVVQNTSTTTTTSANTPPPNSPQNTDAWFVGYAPVGRAAIAAGALFPSQGAGGATAAPAVRGVLLAGLHRGG